MLGIPRAFFVHSEGNKMKVPFVDLGAQYAAIKAEIDNAIFGVIAECSFIRGPHVDDFESSFAGLIGSPRCISTANGTDSLYIAMRALGVKPGDEVITTAHSWISTSETISQAGGKVIFCDTDVETFTLDPDMLESLISPRTVGIIPVHLYGHPANMPRIMSMAERGGLWVIEDCAQSHLATIEGRCTGTIGNFGSFSFYPGKNLGAYGDAGCLVTADAKLAEWCTLFARHGGKGDHVIEGINSRLDGMQAAILNAKLPHLRSWTAKRQEIASRYSVALRGLGDIRVPTVANGCMHAYHLYVVRTQRRDELRAFLKHRGIDTIVNYPKALPFYPAYSHLRHSPGDFPNAYANQSVILSLPMFPELTMEQQEYIIDSMRAFFGC